MSSLRNRIKSAANTRAQMVYLSMFRMIGAHPHATWHSGQRRVEAVHVKSQWAEITMDKLTNKLTPTK